MDRLRRQRADRTLRRRRRSADLDEVYERRNRRTAERRFPRAGWNLVRQHRRNERRIVDRDVSAQRGPRGGIQRRYAADKRLSAAFAASAASADARSIRDAGGARHDGNYRDGHGDRADDERRTAIAGANAAGEDRDARAREES